MCFRLLLFILPVKLLVLWCRQPSVIPLVVFDSVSNISLIDTELDSPFLCPGRFITNLYIAVQLMCIIVTIGTVIQTASQNIGMFLAGRVLAGIAVG